MSPSNAALLSVITPSLNHAAYLPDTIESVLAQDWPNVEHIVVDGGSTDGTVQILEQYGKRYPDRFRWVSEPDRGQSDALNKGLAMARGAFIGWQNSDDYYYPRVLGGLAAYLTQHPHVAAVYGSCHFVSPTRDIIRTWRARPYRFTDLLEENFIPNQSALLRRSHVLAVGGLDTGLRYAMDYDLWLRLGVRFELAFLPGVWGAFRQLPEALTATGWVHNRLESVSALRRAAADPSLPSRWRSAAGAAVQHGLHEAILVSLLEGKEAIAGQLLRDSLRDDPERREWHDMERRLLGRAYATRPGRGREVEAHLCRSLLAVLRLNGLGASDQARGVIAISYLQALLDQHPSRTCREIGAYGIRMLRTQGRIAAHRPFIGIIARLVLGDERAFRLEASAKREQSLLTQRSSSTTRRL